MPAPKSAINSPPDTTASSLIMRFRILSFLISAGFQGQPGSASCNHAREITTPWIGVHDFSRKPSRWPRGLACTPRVPSRRRLLEDRHGKSIGIFPNDFRNKLRTMGVYGTSVEFGARCLPKMEKARRRHNVASGRGTSDTQ